VIFVASLFLIKESPAEVGEPEPHTNPENVYGAEGEQARQSGLAHLLIPLLTNPVFWVVCILSFGFTMVRETFNDWIPTYLVEKSGMKDGDAALWSSLFPLFGGFSVLIAGFLSDKMGHAGRAKVILGGLIIVTPALFALAYVDFGTSPVLPLIGRIADSKGWGSAFETLAAVAVLTTVAAGVYLWQKSQIAAPST